MRLYCVKCGKEINAALTTGFLVYPHRPDLSSKYFWECPHCHNFVGCHRGTTRPLGCIPTDELKRIRMRIHAEMDVIWKTKQMSRKDLYRLISDMLGYTYHTGETRTVEECEKILRLVRDIKLGLLNGTRA